ncbi:MAG: aminotransferase class V-fold PLP-dependent enzyme [Rhodospirillales bacterium]|nr:aminotransferase class V-fold PLP-dependent enzyme [Rhodospirillales bacterium]
MAARAAPGTRRNRAFSQASRPWDDLKAEMLAAHADDNPWCDERSFSAAYFAGEDLLRCAHEAYDAYRNENGLFAASAYPSLAACERELIAGVLDLLHAPEGAGGSTTAGGTESILMAMKAARDWAREHRPVAGVPEVVVPKTAHAAFDKGAAWLGMKVVRMSRSEGWRADVAGMAAAITGNTVMIAGSAPPYPYGETDPIEEIAALAREHDLWMHSDGCIGGMILPFMTMLGEPIPPFDFAVPGVTSMSVDMHKFGYAHKGISLCLLRDKALERYHRTTFDGWPAGTYSTPTITGTRSGGGVASAWAVMTHLGEEGYLRIYEAQRHIRERLVDGIGGIDGLAVLGRPHALHVTFYAEGFDIFAVEEGTAARGWRSIRMREPDSILLWLNMKHAESIDAYLADLAEVTADVRSGGLTAATRGASSYAT